jgi:hypothetical protein
MSEALAGLVQPGRSGRISLRSLRSLRFNQQRFHPQLFYATGFILEG